MAIFKDKTGRGEVNYAQGPVQGQAGTVLVLNDLSGLAQNVFAPGAVTHTVFQLRGDGGGVTDVSSNSFAVTETSSLTKRIEDVNHRTRLKTFEFTAGQSLSLSASLNPNIHGGFFDAGGGSLNVRQANMTTILPYQTAHPSGSAGHEAIISGWIYIDSYNTAGTNGGSCIMESVSGTSRGFGIILSSTGELIFRMYDWGADSTLNNSSTRDFQQIKTRKKLSLRAWHHFTIFFHGLPGPIGYRANGLDEPTALNRPPVADIFINGVRQLNPSESGKTSGTFTGTVPNADLPIVLGTGLGGYDEDSSNKVFTTDAQFYGRLAEVNYFLTLNLAVNGTHINANPDRSSDFYLKYREKIARALMSGNRQPASGLTNVSERLLLRDLDQASTHPTVKRSGDQRRLGNHTLVFDDTRTQTLRGSTVQYPTKLVPGDALSDTIYNGYFDGALTTQHTASTDSYDTFYRRADQPAHVPFVESRIYIDSGSSFYITGTLESVIPGFDRPLHSKEVVDITLTNDQQCQLGSTPTADHTNTLTDRGRLDYMAYWNNSGFFETKPGITFHNASTAANNLASQRNISTGSCIGFLSTRTVFTASTGAGFRPDDDQTFGALQVGAYPDEYFNSFGRPSDLYAFPDDSRYVATGSNLIDMSDYIAEPFLVEKIVYEFEAIDVRLSGESVAFGTTTGAGLDGFGGTVKINAGPHSGNEFYVRSTRGLQALHCFLMRQYKKSVSGNRSITFEAGTKTFTSASAVFESTETQRELIDYQSRYFTASQTTAGHPSNLLARNVFANTNITSSVPPIFKSAYDSFDSHIAEKFATNPSVDLEFLSSGNSNVPHIMENFRLESNVKTAVPLTFAGSSKVLLPNNPGATAAAIGTWSGGAGSISDDRSVRHIVKSTVGKKNPNQALIALTGGSNPTVFTAVVSQADGAGDAPYVLMPQDKIVFGVQAAHPQGSADFPNQGGVQITPGTVKIRLFGSYLRNSQPRQFQLNQLLNNDIVHEAIGQESIHDQFDIEPRGAFTGSYADEVISGSFTAPYNGFDAISQTTVNLARRVGGRSSEGTLGVTGSFRRSLPLVSDNKTEYDSFLFDLESIWRQDTRNASTGLPGDDYLNDFEFHGTVLDFAVATDDPALEVPQAELTTATKPNINFRTSYIFDRYHDVRRVRTQQLFADASQGFLLLTGSNLFDEQRIDGYIATNPDYPPSTPYVDSDADGRLSAQYSTPEAQGRFSNQVELAKFLFTLGEGPKSAHYFDHAPGSPGNDGGVFFIRGLRGFKYGLSNIVDKKPKNVFRRDRYGQLRDMLEMAPNTAYIDDKTNLVSYPIEAQFFDGDGSLISPEATSCSNLSTNLTSSAPFFDRDVVDFSDPLVIRNRGPLNNKVVDLTIEI